MKTKVITTQELSLDFGTHQFEFPRPTGELKLMWQKELRFPQTRNWLKWINEKLYLVAAPHEIIEIGKLGLPEIQKFDEPIFQIYRSFKSDPIIVTENGSFYRWAPKSNAELIRKNKSAGKLITPIGLPENSILYLKDRGTLPALIPGLGRWAISFIESRDHRVRWSRNQFLYNYLPSCNGFFMVAEKDRSIIEFVHTESGKTIWECRIASTISRFSGLVNDILWIIDNDGNLIAIDSANGKVINQIKLAGAKYPQGIIDEKGRYIICNGVNLIVVDFTHAEKIEILYQGKIAIKDEHSCSTVAGNRVLLTKDEHLIFYDYYNRVFAVPLFKADEGIYLWQAPEQIRDLGVSGNFLIALHGASLTCLGSSPGSTGN